MSCFSELYPQFQLLRTMNSPAFVVGGLPPTDSFSAGVDAISSISIAMNRRAVINELERKYRGLEPQIIKQLTQNPSHGVLIGLRVHYYGGGRAVAAGGVFIAATGRNQEAAMEMFRNTPSWLSSLGTGWQSRNFFFWVTAPC